MKRWITTIYTFCLCCVHILAQQKDTAPINYGVKAGFSSTIYEVRELTVADMPINNYMAQSEISSFYTAFVRANIKRHYLQTELSYNISNYSLEFDTNQWNTMAQAHEKSTFSTKIVGFEVPLLYGYHLLKQGPYGLSFYAGPKAKFILTNYSSHTFEQSPYKEIQEKIRPINFSIMAGIGINISRVFFDFSFEYGLHNISNGFVTTDATNITRTDDLIFNRRKNVLSFSLGFIF